MEAVAGTLRPPRSIPRALFAYAGVALACLALGTAVARGGPASLALLLLSGGAALAVLFAELRIHALTVWIALAPLAFPFLRWPSESALLTFDRVWIGGLAGIVLLARARVPATRTSRFFGLALLLLVLVYGVRSATSPNVLGSLETWVDAILLPAVLYAAVRQVACDERACRRIAGALALAGLTLAAVGIASKLADFELASRSGGVPRLDTELGLIRISGPYDFPEPYALSLLVCLAGTLWWAQLRRGPALWLGGALAGAQLAAIGLTLFRAAWIGAVLVLVTAFGLRPRRMLRFAAVSALAGGVVLAGMMAFGDNDTVATRVGDTANIYARLATYVQGVEAFREAPLTGVGVGEFANAQAGRADFSVQGIDALEYAHSSYVSTLVEQGALGFVPLVAVTLAGWWLVRRFRAAAPRRIDVLLAAAATGAGAAYLVMSLSLTMLPYGPSNAFVAVLLGAVAGRMGSLNAARSGEHA